MTGELRTERSSKALTGAAELQVTKQNLESSKKLDLRVDSPKGARRNHLGEGNQSKPFFRREVDKYSRVDPGSSYVLVFRF